MALLTPIRTVVRTTLLVTLPMLKDSTIPPPLTVIHHSTLTRAIRATQLALPPPPMLLAVPMVRLTTDTILSSHTGVILQLPSSRLTSLHRSTQLLLAVPRRIVQPPQLRSDKPPLLSPQWSPSKCAISELWRLTCSSLVFVSSRGGSGITLHEHFFLFRCPMIPIELVFIMVQTSIMPFTSAPCCSSRWMMIRHRIHGWDFSPRYQRSCSVAESNDE